MIAMAVLGHNAPATSWSDIDEERKKALFSLLRQGVPFVVWDNIRRGEAVSCPHIEASLTSEQITDRILGVSQTETVSTAAIQVFPGNQITPKGDMSSRSFVIALDADQPNPEDRDFVHPDPLEWTRSNRFKIMGALYTILIAGARNRQLNEIAKTRFKTWWRLVGWPVEYAAKLMGQELHCDQLFKASEAKDPEVLAIATVLSTFRAIWGTNRFTARDIVQKLPGKFDILTSPDDKQGAVLFEALSELLGKSLKGPTARSIAKLLQRRLIGHPIWSGNNTIATLRVLQNHEANEYWVELTLPNNPSRLPRTASNNPDNPDNPDRNAGIDGIDFPSQGTTERKSWRRPSRVDLSKPAFREKLAQGLRRLNTPGDPDAQSFKSKSDPKVTHYVTKDPNGVPRCTCAAYRFRRTCKHVKSVQSGDDE